MGPPLETRLNIAFTPKKSGPRGATGFGIKSNPSPSLPSKTHMKHAQAGLLALPILFCLPIRLRRDSGFVLEWMLLQGTEVFLPPSTEEERESQRRVRDGFSPSSLFGS